MGTKNSLQVILEKLLSMRIRGTHVGHIKLNEQYLENCDRISGVTVYDLLTKELREAISEMRGEDAEKILLYRRNKRNISYIEVTPDCPQDSDDDA